MKWALFFLLTLLVLFGARSMGAQTPATLKNPVKNPVSLNDITYQLPDGWTETRSDGAAIFSVKGIDQNRSPRACTLVMTPGLPKTGSLQNSLRTQWQELISPQFEGIAKPFPIAGQLTSGLNCAFCVAEMKAKRNGGKYAVSLYAVDAGESIVLIMALYTHETVFMLTDKQYTDGLEHFLNSLTVRDAPLGKPLATRDDLAGTWSTSSTSFANYVDSGGNYAGDASIASGQTYTFGADGTFTHTLAALNARVLVKERESGTYRIEGPLVVMTDKSTGRVTQFWFRGRSQDEHGTMLVLSAASGKPALFSGISNYETRLVLTPPK